MENVPSVSSFPWPQQDAAALCPCLEASLDDLPLWEPEDNRYVDLNDLQADDPLWDELLATPLIETPLVPSG